METKSAQVNTCSIEDWNEISKNKSFIKLPRKAINYLLYDDSITQTDKFVWLFLSMSSLTNLGTTEIQLSTAEIGKWINRSNNTITKSLTSLANAGYIKLEKTLRSKKTNDKHQITVLFPEENWNSICKEKSFIKLPWCTFIYLLKEENLSQTNKLVWLSLLSYTFTNPDTRELHFSSAQIANMMNRTRSPVSRSLKALGETGYIKLENPLRSNKSNDRHKITVLFPNQAILTFKAPLKRNEADHSSLDEQQSSINLVEKLPDNTTNTPAENNLANLPTIFFGLIFLILHKVTQILHRITQKVHTYNKIFAIRSFVLDNIVNRVKTIRTFIPQSKILSNVENVFLVKTNSEIIDDNSLILIKAEAINVRFHLQLKKRRELGLSFSIAVKQADEELNSEERHLLTQAACIVYVRYEFLCSQYQAKGCTKEISESKALGDLSSFEQDLLNEYQCQDVQHQTRLNRNAIETTIKKIIEIPLLPSFRDKVNYLKSLYQHYENVYHEKLREGLDVDAAKHSVFKLLTKEKYELFLDVAETVCNQTNEEAHKMSKLNGKNLSASYEDIKENMSSFEQKLFLEYTSDPRGTLLGLRDLPRCKKNEKVESVDLIAKPASTISFVKTPSETRFNIDIPSDMLGRVIGWLYTMRKKGQIAKNTSHKEMERLIEEVAYHAIHWRPTSERYMNLNETEKMKLAISIACRAIRHGKWMTPYGLVVKEIIKREQNAEQWKEWKQKEAV